MTVLQMAGPIVSTLCSVCLSDSYISDKQRVSTMTSVTITHNMFSES
jgi:hypothetical protein